MPDRPFDTVNMNQCVERFQAGDRAAADELARGVSVRLEHLARKMLRDFPAVRGCAETGDVLQGSLIRLLHALKDIRPNSTRHFFNLAAVCVRRELLDLARSYSRERMTRAFSPLPRTADESQSGGLLDPADKNLDADLELWCRFHEAVEQLDAEEREVLSLVFYHGWTQVQIAELLQVDERTIRRRWQSACLQLHRLVGAELPQT